MFAYLAILLAYSIFLTLSFKEPKLAILAVLSGIAITAVGLIVASQSYILLGASMIVLGIAPLVPMVTRLREEEEF